MRYTAGETVRYVTWLFDANGDKVTSPNLEAGDFKYLKDGVMIGNADVAAVGSGNGLVAITVVASATVGTNLLTLAWYDVTTPQWKPDTVNLPLLQPVALPQSIAPDLSTINPETASLWAYLILTRERQQVAGTKEWIMNAAGNTPVLEALTYHVVATSVTTKENWKLITP